MKEQVTQIVAAYWQGRLPALLNRLADAARQLGNVLTLEDYYRTAHKSQERLGKSLGGFGSEALDLKALSSVLQQGHESRALEKHRYQKLQRLTKELQAVSTRFKNAPPAPALHDLQAAAPQALLEAFEAHMVPLAEALRLVRMARLEARGRYDPATHDALFERFNWRHLDNSEMALCPPFVVTAEPDTHRGAQLGALIELVASGRPVKLALLHSSWHPEHEETGRAAALQAMDDVALLFLGLRNVYFVQTSVASPTPLAERVTAALESPRPAVLSVYAHGADDAGFAQRAASALASRAFPHFVYDPDRAPDFVSCLDLSDNPEPEAAWVNEALAYVGDDGERAEVQRPLTFADYAAFEPELAAQFAPLTAEQEGHATALVDYLQLGATQRWNRVPFVYGLDADKHLARRVPSAAILAHTTDRLHLWNTLQELAGIQNPYIAAAERRVREELTAEKERALAEQKAQLDTQAAASQQTQVAAALRNVALRLTGMSSDAALPAAAVAPAAATSAAAPALVATAAPAAQAAPAPATASPAPAAPAQEGPWIDQRLCTSCDECIAISKSLFSYNGTKKAVIKDPHAGPYKDIVRAAEKCSSGAIHPGLPLDPNEKDTDKWIKRAEKYQ
jgi:pyruvate-ferredoxin/flavodoxin oxidoreductase